jgi:hypothetical protein
LQTRCNPRKAVPGKWLGLSDEKGVGKQNTAWADNDGRRLNAEPDRPFTCNNFVVTIIDIHRRWMPNIVYAAETQLAIWSSNMSRE